MALSEVVIEEMFSGNAKIKIWEVLLDRDNYFVSVYKIQYNTNIINRAINKYIRVFKTMKKIFKCHFK